jgi:hypothetical protein
MSSGPERDMFSRGPSASLVLAKEGSIDMDDDGTLNILKTGVLASTESGTSLDKLQDGHGPAPAPPHVSVNEITNTMDRVRPRISVDITRHWREGSEDLVETMLARTVEEHMYGTDAVPLSDATIVDEGKYYAAAAAASAAAAGYFGRQPAGAGVGVDVGADAEVEPYRFDFDALPLPAGMSLPPWQQQTLQSQSLKAGWRRGGARGARGARGASGVQGLAERKIFAPLTKVLSPLVTRAQWIIIVRSALIGLVLACAVGGASMAIH